MALSHYMHMVLESHYMHMVLESHYMHMVLESHYMHMVLESHYMHMVLESHYMHMVLESHYMHMVLESHYMHMVLGTCIWCWVSLHASCGIWCWSHRSANQFVGEEQRWRAQEQSMAALVSLPCAFVTTHLETALRTRNHLCQMLPRR